MSRAMLSLSDQAACPKNRGSRAICLVAILLALLAPPARTVQPVVLHAQQLCAARGDAIDGKSGDVGGFLQADRRTSLYSKPTSVASASVDPVRERARLAYNSTVITGYFQVFNRHSDSQFLGWIPNLLSMQDAMIIFTTPDMVETMTNLRAHAINRTRVIPVRLDELVMASRYPAAFWKRQNEIDPKTWLHRQIPLYWVYHEKANLVERAVALNPFQSEFLAWADAALIRTDVYNGDRLIKQVPESLGRNQLLVMQSPDEDTPFIYDGGYATGLIGGYVPGLQKFARAYYEAFDNNKHEFIGDDQIAFSAMCKEHRCMCYAVIPNRNLEGTPPWRYMTPYMRGDVGQGRFQKMPDECKQKPLV